MKKQIIARTYLGTYNNPPVEFAREYIEKWHTEAQARYAVGQLEKGAEGTIHIQFYINFDKPKAITALKKHCAKAHFEPVKVDNGAAQYCMKEDTRVEGPWEFGTKPVKRNSKEDWEEVKQNAMKGELDKIPADIFVKHYANLRQIAKDHQVNINREEARKCIWLYGKAGCGKTRTAVAKYPEAYMKLSNKWWDGYRGHKAVILDDLDPVRAGPLTQHLKHWADPWGKMPGEIKGGQVPLVYDTFVVTSQYHPAEIWTDPKDLEAMTRRFEVEEILISYQTTAEGVFHHE